ncbi:hypothetical protein T492DRAFT_901012 [Pavlovales sp. CCMP2436]|nr:hypothetical protein T492DRAFT_901012 [Pavlovales sp. CCMP2436]
MAPSTSSTPPSSPSRGCYSRHLMPLSPLAPVSARRTTARTTPTTLTLATTSARRQRKSTGLWWSTAARVVAPTHRAVARAVAAAARAVVAAGAGVLARRPRPPEAAGLPMQHTETTSRLSAWLWRSSSAWSRNLGSKSGAVCAACARSLAPVRTPASAGSSERLSAGTSWSSTSLAPCASMLGAYPWSAARRW